MDWLQVVLLLSSIKYGIWFESADGNGGAANSGYKNWQCLYLGFELVVIFGDGFGRDRWQNHTEKNQCIQLSEVNCSYGWWFQRVDGGCIELGSEMDRDKNEFYGMKC